MLLAAIAGLCAVFIGAASADDTPSSAPALPDVTLAPAVVVAAGADTIDTNAVTRLSAYRYGTVEEGTGFRLDDGRIATVAHALVDARGVALGDEGDDGVVPLDGEGAAPTAIDELHDLGAILANTPLASLRLSDVPATVGDSVALAGYPGGGRIEVVTGTVIARTDGAGYGLDRPDVYVIDTEVGRGWSGGPVANIGGNVVGVIVAVERTSGVTLAVPIEYLPQP